ncbi:SIR2 family protein [Olivibacter sp. XZL3]|uniref:SIR2 family protein n=1 Tax=Olivibacter sp. XZL3 TaxID=1735116 RepID=UPI0010651C76|nr:SIR2 family protein [Olivibacter sp. XZL3]
MEKKSLNVISYYNFRILVTMDSVINLLIFSIYSNKGVYALLLGSGISRNSGIPTGWDIVIDLIKKIAHLEKEDCGDHPDQWYRQKYNEEPDYSNLLEKLATTPTERLNILRTYFESTEEEDEAQLRRPTKAHDAIAKLVKRGYIKVVITTNFDRLLETSLRNEGIEPVVIRHPSDIAGAAPLVHSPFTLIKINGDYLDSRFLNTKDELESYDDILSKYIITILDDFGIISCGWSGKWDNGLINTLRASANYRYSSFWTHISDKSSELQDVATFRKGRVLKIRSADSFFEELVEKLEALERSEENNVISIEMATARAKKYLSKAEYFIQLSDLLAAESRSLEKLIAEHFDPALYPSKDNLAPVLQNFTAAALHSLPLLMTCTYWSKPTHHKLITDFITRTSRPRPISASYDETRNLYYFPVLLQLYGVGIIALKTENYPLLDKLFRTKIAFDYDGYRAKEYLISKVNSALIAQGKFNEFIGERHSTPISTYVNQRIADLFTEYFDSPADFTEAFDLFEYLLALNHVYLIGKKFGFYSAPYGEFKWRSPLRNGNTLTSEFLASAKVEKESWLPLKAGMFDKSFSKFEEVHNDLQEYLAKIYLR